LTSIQRLLNKYDNPNLNVSFDAASPFVAAGGYALVYNYNKFDTNQLTYAMGRAWDKRELKGSNMAMPFQGPIMERLTMGDMCVLGPDDKNKQGKIGKTSWDTTSYALIMAHNVYNHIQAVQEINRLADIEYKIKTGISDFVPNPILFFNEFAEQLLDPTNPDPYLMIQDNLEFLDYISFGNKEHATEYGNLFGEINEVPADHIPTGEEMASSTDEKLRRFEEENE
jgi:hypothetical protein